MFNISIKRLFYVCDKVVTRNIRSRRLDSVPVANPGLQRRIDALREDGVKIKDYDAEEIVEQSDSDFKNVGQVYNEHLNETMIGKHELRHHIVKEKYFKENMPNLLTWSEKEQIRHLANTLPDEWTPERIAESFPVTAEVAKKLLKYPWKPASEQRIQRHDSSAMRNWRELKEGTLDIPEHLQQHFLKFLERTIPPLNKKSIKIDLTNSAKIGEFERIIQKCAHQDEKAEQDDNETSFHTANETGLSVQNNRDKSEKRDRKRITLEDLTARIQTRLEKGKDVDMPDKLILDCVNAKDIESAKYDNEMRNEVELATEEHESDVADYKEKNEVVVSPEVKYPLRIRIPKKAYKKGATYKVNDCYYDHDGKFLYRVIGMSN